MSDLSREVAYWKAAHLELAERLEKADADVTRLTAELAEREVYWQSRNEEWQASFNITNAERMKSAMEKNRLTERWEALKAFVRDTHDNVEATRQRAIARQPTLVPELTGRTWALATLAAKMFDMEMTELEAQR